MQDFFYFTKAMIGLQEIDATATEHQLRTGGVKGDLLNVFVDGVFMSVRRGPDGNDISTPHPEYWAWTTCDYTKPGDISLESHNRRILEAYAPMSGFMISIHLPTISQFSLFLSDLLNKYGGWVGLDVDWVDDDGNSQYMYSSDTINQLPFAFDGD